MMEDSLKIIIRCLPVTQPIGTFYVGTIKSEDLVDIAWADVRRICHDDRNLLGQDEKYNAGLNYTEERAQVGLENAIIEEMDTQIIDSDDHDFEQFLGIQRQLSAARVKEIQQYVGTQDATFPTSVLLAVSSKSAIYDEKSMTITINRHNNAAKIIDGQHRIAGLRGYEGPQFDVNASIFIDMDLQDQAMVFATINLKQTKVNKSLAYDLYQFTKTRSPQRSAHDIVRFLNYKKSSPFFSKVKMLGTGTGRGRETITQATFVDRLLRYMTKDPMGDRDTLRRGRKLSRTSGKEREWHIFRDWFIDDMDVNITVVLWNYFTAVRAKWPKSWDQVVQGNVLNRTAGFGALMRFMRVAYRSQERPGSIMSREAFVKLLEPICLEDETFTPSEYVPGSSGERKLFDVLVSQSNLQQWK